MLHITHLRGMQIKITRYDCTPIKMAVIKVFKKKKIRVARM